MPETASAFTFSSFVVPLIQVGIGLLIFLFIYITVELSKAYARKNRKENRILEPIRLLLSEIEKEAEDALQNGTPRERVLKRYGKTATLIAEHKLRQQNGKKPQ